MERITRIKGLSDSRRMPRIGKIRLGAKIIKESKKEKSVEYPVELPFFLLPVEIAAVHGGKIKNIEEKARDLGVSRADVIRFCVENQHRLAEEIPVMIPVEDPEYSFPQSYKMYGGSIGLKCYGDGENAQERIGITSEFKSRSCPCEQLKNDSNPKGNCSVKAHLSVMVPDVAAGGIFQIDIGSINSIIDINSGIDHIKALVGRVAMIPLKLKRIPTETHHEGKKQIHWTVQLIFDGNIYAIAELRKSAELLTHHQVLQLEEPDYTDPKEVPADATYQRTEEIVKKIDDLREFGNKKKLHRGEGKEIQEAIETGNDEKINEIHQRVTARNSGKTQNETAEKLKVLNQKKADTPPEITEFKNESHQEENNHPEEIHQTSRDRF